MSGQSRARSLPCVATVHGNARAVDDERDRRRCGDECLSVDVETEQRGRPYPTLITDEATQESRQRAAHERGTATPEAHALREPGQAPEPREDQKETEDDRESGALKHRLKECAGEAADRARRTEAKQDLAIEVRPHDEEAHEGRREVGQRHGRDREAHVVLRRQHRGEHAPDAEPRDRRDGAGDDRASGREDGECLHAFILQRG